MLQNNAKAPFDDLNFRLAVAHAVDRKTIAEKIYFGLIEPSSGTCPGLVAGGTTRRPPPMMTYDLDKAKGVSWRSPNTKATPRRLNCSPAAEAYLLDTNDCAVFLQAELAKVGIKVVLKKGILRRR